MYTIPLLVTFVSMYMTALTAHLSPSIPFHVHTTSCVCPPENIKSPVTDAQVEFSAIDPLFSKEGGAATGKNSNLLSVARMPPTPSLEDVTSLTDYPNVSRSFSKDSSESDEGFNDGEGKVVNESLDSLASHDDSVSSARTKRER